MTDRPIIFSAPMIRALLAGRKTQTRRVLKPQPPEGAFDPWPWATRGKPGYIEFKGADGAPLNPWPYTPGDRLWVREGWANDEGVGLQYRAGPQIADDAVGVRWLSRVIMPRWASRLTLDVKEVRIERLQDISEGDAVAEGVDAVIGAAEAQPIDGYKRRGGRADFAALWNSIHGPAAWDANPWVVALTFDVHRCNIDQWAPDAGFWPIRTTHPKRARK